MQTILDKIKNFLEFDIQYFQAKDDDIALGKEHVAYVLGLHHEAEELLKFIKELESEQC